MCVYPVRAQTVRVHIHVHVYVPPAHLIPTLTFSQQHEAERQSEIAELETSLQISEQIRAELRLVDVIGSIAETAHVMQIESPVTASLGHAASPAAQRLRQQEAALEVQYSTELQSSISTPTSHDINIVVIKARGFRQIKHVQGK